MEGGETGERIAENKEMFTILFPSINIMHNCQNSLKPYVFIIFCFFPIWHSQKYKKKKDLLSKTDIKFEKARTDHIKLI